MDKNSIEKYINKMFTAQTLPYLMDFIRIPNLTPSEEPRWKEKGFLLKAANLVISFAQSLNLKNAEINLFQDDPHSPLIFIDIKATRPNDERTILLYGHVDKQAHGVGWDKNKSPIIPVIEDGYLYGRGSVDDGYSSFSILTAIKACQDHNYLMPRICLIVEANEESGEDDMMYYLDKLKPVIGDNCQLFIPMDCGCGSYDRIWITSGTKGGIITQISIETLSKESPYGPEASGKVAEPFFILRKILGSIENFETEELLIDELFCKNIPHNRIDDIEKEAKIAGDEFIKHIPLASDVSPLKTDPKELMINCRWKPTLTVTGIDNIQEKNENGINAKNILKAVLIIRIPPLVEVDPAIEALKKRINENVFFNAKVKIEKSFGFSGNNFDNFNKRNQAILNKASKLYFGNELGYNATGGGLPLLDYFKGKFPNCDICMMGVLGMDGHEHGPNERLNLDACKKLIMCLCYLLSEF